MSTNGPARRRRGAVAREEALEAARDLLLSGGPAAVTLKAVGERMGVGHANLIHHFGSAAGLQGALMDRMVRDLADRIEAGLGAGRDDVEPAAQQRRQDLQLPSGGRRSCTWQRYSSPSCQSGQDGLP